MATFIKGDVVVLPFPFFDLSSSKKRPALVLSNLTGNDIILCQITSQNTKDNYAISLTNQDFLQGSLTTDSNIRPNRLFTADKNIILYKVGSISKAKYQEVFDKILSIIQP